MNTSFGCKVDLDHQEIHECDHGWLVVVFGWHEDFVHKFENKERQVPNEGLVVPVFWEYRGFLSFKRGCILIYSYRYKCYAVNNHELYNIPLARTYR